MKPIAFTIGPLTIHWYGIMMAIGFFSGFALINYRAKKRDFAPENALDIAFYGLLSSVIGARLFYVMMNFSDYKNNLIEIIRIDKGGLVYYGGVIAASATIIYHCRKKKYNIPLVADIFTPSISLGQIFGRIGCFTTGCCFGKICTNFFAVQFPKESLVWQIQLKKHLIPIHSEFPAPVFPVQLLASLCNLLFFLFLLYIDKKRKLATGQLFCIYLIGYGIIRFCTEFLRGDYIKLYGPFTIAQLVCFVIVPVGLYFYVNREVSKTLPANSSE